MEDGSAASFKDFGWTQQVVIFGYLSLYPLKRLKTTMQLVVSSETFPLKSQTLVPKFVPSFLTFLNAGRHQLLHVFVRRRSDTRSHHEVIYVILPQRSSRVRTARLTHRRF